MGYLKSKKAIPDLAAIAFRRQGKGNRDRWMAVRSLGLIGDKAVMGDLIHLLYYYNQNVRLYARVSLVRLAGRDLGPDWQKWAAWYKNRVDDNFPTKKIEWTADKKMANEKLQIREDQLLLKNLTEEWKIKNKYSR
ncbi:MAG: HEAT repeat domain-containing protein [Sedimentisphaerales bacterium]